MKREIIFEKLVKIFRDTFDDDSIMLKEETSSIDINEWDSFMHINIISQIEDEFDIQFPMDVVTEVKTIGEIINKIIELTS